VSKVAALLPRRNTSRDPLYKRYTLLPFDCILAPLAAVSTKSEVKIRKKEGINMALSIRLMYTLLLVAVSASLGSSFTLSPQSDRRSTTTKLALFPMPMPVAAAAESPMVDTAVTLSRTTASPLQDGVTKYITMSTSSESFLSSPSSSLQLSLKDRVIPTAEEIEAKKFNFNVIFWGGGFVAPLLATVFYFGFRFWEK
jgi:hypothetical protein